MSELSTRLKLDKAKSIVNLTNSLFPKCAFLKYYPLVVSRGRGSKIWDVDGNEYIDFVSGAAVYNIGHLHEAVVKSIEEQLSKYLAYPIVYFYTEEPCRLAKRLVEITPGPANKKVVFGFSGSDAMDLALLISRATTQRKYILSFKGSFHGSTFLTMAVSGIISEELKKLYQLFVANVLFSEYPNPYRNSWNIDGYENPEDLANLALDSVEREIKKVNGDVAAIAVEAIQGDGGIIVPPKSFMVGLSRLAREYGVILIVDEVKTGMGRTGKWWAIEHFNVEPDIIVAGKALGGGMPISAVIGRSDILDNLPPSGLSFTLSPHALSVASALATIEVIIKEDLINRASRLGDYIARRLQSIASESKIIGDVRGKGLLMGVEVVSNKATKTPDKPLTLKAIWRAWEYGVVLLSVGIHGNVIRLAPPLNVPMEDVERALHVIEKSIKDVEEGRVPDGVLAHMIGW